MNFLRTALTILGLLALSACSPGGFTAMSSSQVLLNAAKVEIDHSNATHNHETACSIYVHDVLERAGYHTPSFTANEFDDIAAKYLSGWHQQEFTTDDLTEQRTKLRDFLNSFPDETAFVGQWPREGESGHVAIIEKASTDHFRIYQAQQGKNAPYDKDTSVEALLYPRNSNGNRGHLILYFDQNN